jgi:hypothetical protein
MGKDKSIRMIAFADAGTVSDSWDLFSEMRHAAGLGVNCSRLRALKVYIAKAINPDPTDQTKFPVYVRHSVLSRERQATNHARQLYVGIESEAL